MHRFGRLFSMVLLFGLTGTLLAQTPGTMTLTQPDAFHCKVSFASRQLDGSKLILKGARLEFELGVTITADEVTFDKASVDGKISLSGNVQMMLKHN